MAYTINLTNGTVFATIADGTINQIASGTPSVPLVTLVGKNYAGYGEFLDENFVHLLESGSNSVAPTSPLTGQLWWDSGNNVLKVYNGAGFKVISGATASASDPSASVAAVVGDLWFDTSNQQLKVCTTAGTSPTSVWLVVGPGYTSAQGTSGAIPETILNNVGATKYITSLYVNNVRVGVVFDGASFTPQASLQTAFPTIYPGLTLSSTVSGAVFAGSATNAQLLDSLDSSQFMRSDTNTSTTGTLRVQNNTGLFVGVSNVFNVNTTTTDANIKSDISGGNLIIQANVGGTTYNVARALGASGNFAIANAATVGTTLSVTGNTTGGNLLTAGLVSATGNVTGGNIITSALVQGATLSSTANVQAGNLRTTGLVSATGNITSAANVSGSYILGNGSQLTGLSAAVSVANINDSTIGGTGTTSMGVTVPGGNIAASINGTANVLVLTSGTAYFIGNANVQGLEKSGSNNVGNIGAATLGWFNQAFINGVNSVTLSATANVTGGNLITAAAVSAASVSASGNITAGNVLGGANVNATTHTGTTVSVSGNVTGGNLITAAAVSAASVSASGNITAGNVLGGANVNATTHTGTTVSVSGNITAGNVLGGANVNATTHTGTTVSVTGNVTGAFFIGDGSALTGITAYSNTNATSLMASFGSNVITTTGNITGGRIIATGTISTAGNIVSTAANATANIGSTSTYFNTVHAQATTALYADLAERYAADQPMDAGTVVDLGGTAEITMSVTDCSDRVLGVISTNAAYLMNGGAGDNNTHPAVAIVGRVPVKVIGSVAKGDRLVSAGNGYARAAKPGEASWFTVIGRALEDKQSTEMGMVEATVSVK